MSGRSGLRVRPDVTTGWDGKGYMEAKVQKLEQQFREDSDGRRQFSSIFYGVAIQVDGYTNPSADELKILMSKHGGKYHMYYSSAKTTHVIASNLPHAKRKELRPNQKVVKPEWIVDSLKAKELLPVEKYLVVPLDNGTQNRITGMLGKRKKSTDSLAGTSMEAEAARVPGISSVKLAMDDTPVQDTSVSNKSTSRTICPTTDSNFLSEFYAHSRLHFLSTWKMELTEYVRYLQTEESYVKVPLTGYQKLQEISKTEGTGSGSVNNHDRTVMHVDMDCFFVSVGLLSRPELRGLPVAVTHSSGSSNTRGRPGADIEYEKQFYENKILNRISPPTKQSANALAGEGTSKVHTSSSCGSSCAEIASCSYEARAAGVKNGMFFGKAKQLCPELRVIPYDFEAYRKASDQIYTTLAAYTRHIEAVSCDEVLVDITKIMKETGLSSIRIAACIRQSIKEATGCNSSAGVGPNIAIARMATRRAKPDGEFAVMADEAKEFMLDVAVRDLPGVGRSTASRLQEMGLPTCGHLQKHPIQKLKQEFGFKTGQKLHDMSCGIDDREVKRDKERKSVSAEVNYGIRLSDEDEAKKFLENLSQEVTHRLQAAGMRGRRVTLKVMVKRPEAPLEPAKYGGHGICDSLSRSAQISLKNVKGSAYEDDSAAIYETAWSMLTMLKINVQDLRGIGIQVTQLQPVDSASTLGESSSAAFLKKFMVKKSGMQEQDVEAHSAKHLPAIAYEDVSAALDPGAKEQDVKELDVLNCSFLDALPPELRDEVRENFQQQKQALEKNFQDNESSALVVQRLTDMANSRPSGAAAAPNVLLSGSSKLSAGPSKSSAGSSKDTRGRGRGTNALKSKTHKAQAFKSGRRPPNTGTSPNKLITDMFPVTYSPNKPASARNSPLAKSASPALRSTQTGSVTEAMLTKVKRKLVSIKEEPPIQIEDSDEEPSNTHAGQEEQDEAELPADAVGETPSLGGATTVQEVRQAISEWTDSYKNLGPLKCDVDDFISFLVRTAVEIRNLEKVLLVLKSFRRRLLSLLKDHLITVELPQNISWNEAYSLVCENVQEAVRNAYNGGELDLLSL